MLAGGRDRRRRERADTSAVSQHGEPWSSSALLTIDELLAYAGKLSQSQVVSTRPGARVTPLHALVDDAESVLKGFNRELSEAVRERRAVPPATEWLLDNHYLVQEQILRFRKDLPKGYGAQLPHLTGGPFAGLPRIYEAASGLVLHTDARIDEDYLYRFFKAYQAHSPLTIGETWAVPIMLRAALLANLTKLALIVWEVHDEDTAADEWADRLLTVEADGLAELRSVLAESESRDWEHDALFLLRAHQRLSAQEAVPSAVSQQLEEWIAAAPEALESLRTDEHHRQAALQVSVANTITQHSVRQCS